jgi:hypothetical protein
VGAVCRASGGGLGNVLIIAFNAPRRVPIEKQSEILSMVIFLIAMYLKYEEKS